MQINSILSPSHIHLAVPCKSKKKAIAYIARLFTQNQKVLSSSDVCDSLLARERLGSTGLGHGIGLPHCRIKCQKLIQAAFLTLQEGVEYDALDGQPVDLLFALITPEETADIHLEILADLAEKFSDSVYVNDLRAAKSVSAVYALLTKG